MIRSVGSSVISCRSTDTYSKVTRRWEIFKWPELLHIRQASVKRIQEDRESAIKELDTVGHIAQKAISQAQRFQEDTGDLSSRISQESEKSLKTKIVIKSALRTTRTQQNQLEIEINHCEGEIFSSEEHRDRYELYEDYHDRKSDRYRAVSLAKPGMDRELQLMCFKGAKALLFVPGLNLFASPFLFHRARYVLSTLLNNQSPDGIKSQP